MRSLDEVLNREITEEEMDMPDPREVEIFKSSHVWLWIEKVLILEQRQAIAELTQGKDIKGDSLTEKDMNQRQGAYQMIDKVFDLIDIAKESNNQNKEEQK